MSDGRARAHREGRSFWPQRSMYTLPDFVTPIARAIRRSLRPFDQPDGIGGGVPGARRAGAGGPGWPRPAIGIIDAARLALEERALLDRQRLMVNVAFDVAGVLQQHALAAHRTHHVAAHDHFFSNDTACDLGPFADRRCACRGCHPALRRRSAPRPSKPSCR